MNINYVTESVIIIICLLSIFTDLKYGIIRNIHLISLGTIAIVLNIISSIINEKFIIITYFINAFFAILCSLILYFTKIWAGGDCKLYIIIILAMPYSIMVRKSYGISWLILIPIIAFLCGYIYIIFDSIIQKIKKKDDKKKTGIFKKSVDSFIQYLKFYLVIIFVNHILSVVCGGLGISVTNQWIVMIVNIAIIMFISKLDILKYKSVVIALLIVDIIVGVIDFQWLINIQTFLTWIAIIISNVIKNFVDDYNYEFIDVENVKTGMILSTESSIVLANDRLSRFNKLSDETLKSRLTEEDVKAIIDFSTKRDYIKQVSIVKKIPFALFIALATICVVVGGNLL